MLALQPDQPTTDREDLGVHRLNAAIGKCVIDALGEPLNLFRLDVRRLWEAHYRVNVYVGTGAFAVTVAHSYFLTTDGDGNIVASVPAIVRQY